MILLFRFYNLATEEINNSLFEEDKLRYARYIHFSFDKTKRIKVYEHINNLKLEKENKNNIVKSFGKYIEIDGYKYFRSSKEYLENYIYDVKNYLNIADNWCQIILKIDDDSYSQKYNHYDDIYIVFKTFDEFYLWFKKHKATVGIKIFKKKKHEINNKTFIRSIFSIIENHFNSKQGNIMLFRIIFHPKRYKYII